MTTARYMTPPEVAERLAVNPNKVRDLIRTGELRAVNVAANPSGRPTWKISQDALVEFEQRRSVTPPPPKSRPRRKNVGIIQFF